jgi:hypothetical protein
MRCRTMLSSVIGLTYWLTAAPIVNFASADERISAVVIDSWWSGDYAKEGCRQAKSIMDDNFMLVACESVTFLR